MKKILKELSDDFKKKPIRNTIGWFIVIPVSIPFAVVNCLLLTLIWVLSKLSEVILYSMAKLVLLVEKVNK